MSVALRKALLWLVMLAFPLQGIAAASLPLLRGAGCAVMRMEMRAGSVSIMHPDVHADRMSMASPAAKEHGEMPGCDDPHAAGLLKCGQSGVCSLVAAPTLQMPSLLQAGSSPSPAPLTATLRVAFCTGAPDRPPRSCA
jgi:hypothetical protein